MNWLEKIKDHQRKEFCQSGETGILEYIFENIGTTNKYSVEFGGGDGVNLSNIRYFINNGWEGLQIDYDNKGNSEVKSEFITKDNINQLFDKYCVPVDFDLLSVDLDGNDYWILKELLYVYSPRVVILEFNPCKEGKYAIEYNPDHIWGDDNYYGATFDAYVEMMEKYGYVVVYNQLQLNLVFIRKEILRGLDLPPIDFVITHYHKPYRGEKRWIEV